MLTIQEGILRAPKDDLPLLQVWEYIQKAAEVLSNGDLDTRTIANALFSPRPNL